MPTTPFPDLKPTPSQRHCSNCKNLMSLYTLPRHYGQTMQLDVCLPCHLIWFDPGENLQLTPDATMALFQLIHEHGSASSAETTRMDAVLSCVACPRTLKFTQDRTLRNRFSYRACPQGHGRLMSFYNFMAEKQFIRELTAAERSALSINVRQINCSSCGAPVDIGRQDACGYCRAQVGVFDREAAMKAVQMYLQRRQLAQQLGTSTPMIAQDNKWLPELLNAPGMQGLSADILSAVACAGAHCPPPRRGSVWTTPLEQMGGSTFDLVADGVTGLLSSLFDR